MTMDHRVQVSRSPISRRPSVTRGESPGVIRHKIVDSSRTCHETSVDRLSPIDLSPISRGRDADVEPLDRRTGRDRDWDRDQDRERDRYFSRTCHATPDDESH